MWKVQKVPFLGVVMGEGKVEMEEDKVKRVLKWPTPQCIRDVRKFLGLANYYRWFVKDFAKVALPMNQLTRKDKKWKWGEEQQAAFEWLKGVFTTRPVLATPELDKEFRVKVDTSNFTTGGVLSVKCNDDLWQPVAFISKALSKTERNYKIYDKEMLGVIRCLEAWQHFLENAKMKFEIWTDHKNLEYFMSSQNLNHKQARWALYLSRFDFVLKHIPGSKMGKVDGLNRRSDWKKGVEGDNEKRTLLKPDWIRSIQAREVIVEGIDILERIRKSEAKDDKVIKAVEEMKKAGVKMLRDKE